MVRQRDPRNRRTGRGRINPGYRSRSVERHQRRARGKRCCYKGVEPNRSYVPSANFRLINNPYEPVPAVGRFSTGCSTGGETQSGNVIHETGAPLTLK